MPSRGVTTRRAPGPRRAAGDPSIWRVGDLRDERLRSRANPSAAAAVTPSKAHRPISRNVPDGGLPKGPRCIPRGPIQKAPAAWAETPAGDLRQVCEEPLEEAFEDAPNGPGEASARGTRAPSRVPARELRTGPRDLLRMPRRGRPRGPRRPLESVWRSVSDGGARTLDTLPPTLLEASCNNPPQASPQPPQRRPLTGSRGNREGAREIGQNASPEVARRAAGTPRRPPRGPSARPRETQGRGPATRPPDPAKGPTKTLRTTRQNPPRRGPVACRADPATGPAAASPRASQPHLGDGREDGSRRCRWTLEVTSVGPPGGPWAHLRWVPAATPRRTENETVDPSSQ